MVYIPRLIKQASALPGLTEQEKFVLSLVDGKTSSNEIAKVTGFGLTSVNKILENLSKHGVIGNAGVAAEEPKPKQQEQSIRELYLIYENADPYTILGVPENASEDQIKEAYFEKTKMFHPDSYYARSVSAADKHFLTDVYKKVQQSYETLKTNVREQKTGPAAAGQTAPPPPKQEIRAPLTGRPAGHEQPHDVLTDQIREQVRKAANYYKMGMAAFMKNDYSGAYLNFKIANSHNPYEKEYSNKMKETEKLMKVDRYQDLLKKADISIELNKASDAIEFLQSALELAGEKKFVYYKLASVMYDFNQSMKEAGQYCQQAISLEPKNAEYHLLMAKIYRKAGLMKSSLFEYEQTMSLGMKTDDIKTEVKQLKSTIK